MSSYGPWVEATDFTPPFHRVVCYALLVAAQGVLEFGPHVRSGVGDYLVHDELSDGVRVLCEPARRFGRALVVVYRCLDAHPVRSMIRVMTDHSTSGPSARSPALTFKAVSWHVSRVSEQNRTKASTALPGSLHGFHVNGLFGCTRVSQSGGGRFALAAEVRYHYRYRRRSELVIRIDRKPSGSLPVVGGLFASPVCVVKLTTLAVSKLTKVYDHVLQHGR